MTTKPVEIKITLIGGGSRYWATQLMADLAICPHLAGELVLFDVDHEAALNNVEIANKIFNHPEAVVKFKTRATENIADGLRDADFVVVSIEPGPVQMRYADLEIPRKYGLLQTVGDTVGPGGINRVLRTVPIMVGYAHEIMQHCPKAWVINYTNPMTMSVRAFYAVEPEIKAFGCCHEVFETQGLMALLVRDWFSVPRPDRHEIKLDVSGVNHFTMTSQASWNGIDLMPRLRERASMSGLYADRTEKAQRRKTEQQWFSSSHLLKYDFLKNFGALGAAGDRHLAEFVPWYLTSEETLHRFGVILTPFEYRKKVRSGPAPKAAEFAIEALKPSGEEGIDQIVALLGIESMETNINLPNTGQMPGAPPNAVVETNAQLQHNAVRPIVSSPLPPAALELQRRVIANQELLLQAVLSRDTDMAFAALLNDPQVHLPTDQAWKMFKEMVEYTKDYLPSFPGLGGS
ncbi:MAG: alpha-galactosidase [Proteobacteria bacterium]|nr:alpha-galactosidase [Pseudomonadota bacterium]